MSSLDSINKRIKDLIDELGMNINSFSKLLSLSSNVTIYNIVSGRKSKPSYDILNAIVLSVDSVSADWLLTGRGEMFLESVSKNNFVDRNSVDECSRCNEKERIILAKDDLIFSQKQLINSLQLIIDQNSVNRKQEAS